MILVDLSANCESWIYDPNGSGIHFRDPRICLPSNPAFDAHGQRLHNRPHPLLMSGGKPSW